MVNIIAGQELILNLYLSIIFVIGAIKLCPNIWILYTKSVQSNSVIYWRQNEYIRIAMH